MRHERLHHRDHGMIRDRTHEFHDARIVLPVLRQSDHGLRYEVGEAADRAGSACGAGPTEIALVADEDIEIGKGVDQGECRVRIAPGILDAADSARKCLHQTADHGVGQRHAGHAGNVIENHAAKIAADLAENLCKPGEDGLVGNGPEIEGRRQKDCMGATAQGTARALGSLLDRAGDDAFHKLICRNAEPDELRRDTVARGGIDGGAFTGRAEDRGRAAASSKAIPGKVGQSPGIDSGLRKRRDECRADPEAERQGILHHVSEMRSTILLR